MDDILFYKLYSLFSQANFHFEYKEIQIKIIHVKIRSRSLAKKMNSLHQFYLKKMKEKRICNNNKSKNAWVFSVYYKLFTHFTYFQNLNDTKNTMEQKIELDN